MEIWIKEFVNTKGKKLEITKCYYRFCDKFIKFGWVVENHRAYFCTQHLYRNLKICFQNHSVFKIEKTKIAVTSNFKIEKGRVK